MRIWKGIGTSMQLSRRLQAVADFVSKSAKCVADVGCDHGYVSIYLAKNRNVDTVIAMDLNKGPLERAKENIVKYGCQDKIQTRLSDGIMALKSGEVDTILIAGMGGSLMIKILEQRQELLKNITELILQPQSEIEQVRMYLHKIGFCLKKETMLIEDGKFYNVIQAIQGKETYEKEEYYRYGRILLETKNVVLKEYLNQGVIKYETILNQLSKNGKKRQDFTYQKIEHDYRYIKTALGYYQKGDVYERIYKDNSESTSERI